jgi:arylsulfatase A-like enzyme
MKHALALIALLSVASTAAHAEAPAATGQKSSHPNIVFILADDLGYGDPVCYNPKSKALTPNIDQLAKDGLRFTDAHTPSSVCTPTRYGVLTGRYPWRSALKKGVLNGYSPALIERGRMTLASLLRAAGYRTGCIGKWHLGLGSDEKTDYAKALTPGPNSVGFDYFFGIAASLDMPPYVYIENERITQPLSAKTAGNDKAGRGASPYWREGPMAADFKHVEVLDRLTEKAVDFIGKGADKPFFLYFALSGPHMPVLPNERFRGKTDGPYTDFVSQCDDSVGQVLKALDRAGARENTLVIVTSDNGAYWFPGDIEKWGHRANADLHGQKADIWEGGHRVPFVARWPGKVKAGSTSPEVICLTDMLATFAAIVGTKLPDDAGEDSFNLLPVFLGQKLDGPVREATVHQSSDGTLAIRQGPWRLAPVRGSHGFSDPKNIEPKKGEPEGELFNLEVDLTERTNEWSRQPEIVRRLTSLLEKYQKEGRSRQP